MTETVLRLALAAAAGILAARRSQRVRIAAPAYDELRTPSLVPIRLPGRIGHSLLLESRSAADVTVADPLIGRRTMSRGEFEACWLGSSIWVEGPP